MNTNAVRSRKLSSAEYADVFLGTWTVTNVRPFDQCSSVHREALVRKDDKLIIQEAGRYTGRTQPESGPFDDDIDGDELPDWEEISSNETARERARKRAGWPSEHGRKQFEVLLETPNGQKVLWRPHYIAQQRELSATIRLPSSTGIERIIGKSVSYPLRAELAEHLAHNRDAAVAAVNDQLPDSTDTQKWKQVLNKLAYLKDAKNRGIVEFGILNIKYLGVGVACSDGMRFDEFTEGDRKKVIVGIVVNRFNHAGCEFHAEN